MGSKKITKEPNNHFKNWGMWSVIDRRRWHIQRQYAKTKRIDKTKKKWVWSVSRTSKKDKDRFEERKKATDRIVYEADLERVKRASGRRKRAWKNRESDRWRREKLFLSLGEFLQREKKTKVCRRKYKGIKWSPVRGSVRQKIKLI